MNLKRFPCLFFLPIFCVFALCACGPSNTVRLMTPPPLVAADLPAPNAASVSVVDFEDKRVDTEAIGVRRDGSAFTTRDNVSQWISRAIADELARNGLQVTFANNVNQARSGHPDFMVTGQVDEVWVKENSATEISTQMRIKCTLASRKGRLWSESLNASQSRSGLPSGSAVDNLLLDTLHDLVQPMSAKIVKSIRAAK